jgi:hypothetical protein
LVGDEVREVDSVFEIESGTRKGMKYVLNEINVEPDTVKKVYTIDSVVIIEVEPFVHLLVTDYLTDSAADVVNTVYAWVCGRKGMFLCKSPVVNPGKLDSIAIFADFKKTLANLYSQRYVNADVDSSTLIFDNQTGKFSISIANNRQSSIMIETQGKNVRFITGTCIRRIARTGHPTNIDAFTVGERFLELFEANSMDQEYASVYTMYSLVVCLLLTGRWFKHLEKKKKELVSLLDESGYNAIAKHVNTCSDCPSYIDIVNMLRFTVMSKSKLDQFLD